MYYLWIFHYSLIKGLYTKRWKGMTNSVDGLAFCCLLFLTLFFLILFIDKELLWEIIRKRFPLGPMVKGVLLLLTPMMVFLLSGRLTKQKIKTIRRVIKIKRKLNRVYSIIYVSIFASLFILTFVIAALSRTPI